VPTHRGIAEAELTWVPGSVRRWFTVTHRGTNRAWHRVPMLIETNMLALSQSDTVLTHTYIFIIIIIISGFGIYGAAVEKYT